MAARRALLLFATLSFFPLVANAQPFPDRAVKIVVPYTAGGATDAVGRALAQQLSDFWKQPVIVFKPAEGLLLNPKGDHPRDDVLGQARGWHDGEHRTPTRAECDDAEGSDMIDLGINRRGV